MVKTCAWYAAGAVFAVTSGIAIGPLVTFGVVLGAVLNATASSYTYRGRVRDDLRLISGSEDLSKADLLVLAEADKQSAKVFKQRLVLGACVPGFGSSIM